MPEKDPGNLVFTTEQAAEYLQVTVNFLIAARRNKTGPDYSRPSHKTIRYTQADLDAWLTKTKVRQGA